jgi:hypothetical protein
VKIYRAEVRINRCVRSGCRIFLDLAAESKEQARKELVGMLDAYEAYENEVDTSSSKRELARKFEELCEGDIEDACGSDWTESYSEIEDTDILSLKEKED